MGHAVHSISFWSRNHDHCDLRALGNPMRGSRQACPRTNEYVDSTWGEDGAHYCLRCFRMVGFQHIGLLLTTLLPGGTALESSADLLEISANGNFGMFNATF